MIDADAHLEHIRAQFGTPGGRLRPHAADHRRALAQRPGACSPAPTRRRACSTSPAVPGFSPWRSRRTCRQRGRARCHRRVSRHGARRGRAARPAQRRVPQRRRRAAAVRRRQLRRRHLPRRLPPLPAPRARARRDGARRRRRSGRLRGRPTCSNPRTPAKAGVSHPHRAPVRSDPHARAVGVGSSRACSPTPGCAVALAPTVTFDNELEEWMAHGGPDAATRGGDPRG